MVEFNKKQRRKKGFTLMEAVIAIGIFSFISLAVTFILTKSFYYNDIILEQLKTQNDGRNVIQEVVNNVRRAESSSIGAFSIAEASDNIFSFYANVDGDYLIEKINFYLDDKKVKKSIIKPSGNPLNYSEGNANIVVLAEDVVNLEKNSPLFFYFGEEYNGQGNPLTFPIDLTEIRLVKVQMELEKDPTETPIPLHVEGLVSLRNLKTN